MTPRRPVPALLGALAALVLLALGFAAPAPPSLVVGARPGPDHALIAHLYAAALRYHGTAARVETVDDPLAALDSGAVRVAPGFTGRLLAQLDPESPARAAEQVYRELVSALPEGVAAGDYTSSAEDKPAVAVTEATATAWGGRDLTALTRHCRQLRAGTAGVAAPAAVGVCRPGRPREFPDTARLFEALRGGVVNAAWTTTAAPDTPSEFVVLSDRTALVRAENLVPLYRRNELDERQVLALNEVAGVLDTEALAEMRRKVAAGEDPAAVAESWIAAHPLGR